MVGPSTGAIVHAARVLAEQHDGLAVGVSPDSGVKYTESSPMGCATQPWVSMYICSWLSVRYTPSTEDWANDYLTRAETALEMPIVNFVAFRLAFTNEYESSPASGTDSNTFGALLRLSFGF